MLTAPSDEAFKQDIERIKQMGFNGVRLHQKIEDSRFYYWADVLGLVVWAELPSTYSFNPVARQLSIESLTASLSGIGTIRVSSAGFPSTNPGGYAISTQ